MKNYKYAEVESRWQSYWEKNQTFRTFSLEESSGANSKPKYYILDMFPYPSGSGLHVGHAAGYIGTDIIARKKRMEGYNVLHPMGWDAFGLPAEQYAMQIGQHPKETTKINADNFRRQLKLIGLSYDWSREINTSDASYYKWTQWLFLKLYEKGLVYEKEESVWWCEDLKTVLANEEVIGGKSERGNHPCVRRPLKQWMIKITAYADRLLDDLEGLDWPNSIKKMQQEWIGKSEGAEINFKVMDSSESVTVFTTRPETIFGVTAIVLAPEHRLSSVLASKNAAIQNYIENVINRSERQRQKEVKESSGIFTGLYVLNPFMDESNSLAQIPVFIGDYVLNSYGTGAVMSVPAHNENDFQFSKAYDLPIIEVLEKDLNTAPDTFYEGNGKLINSGFLDGRDCSEARKLIIDEVEKRNVGKRCIRYRLRDWLFSRQRYWGEPFPLSYRKDGSVIPSHENELPITLPEMQDFKPSEDGASPLARVSDWVEYKDSSTGEQLSRVTDTMPGWAGSCWYYLRFMDPHETKECFSKKAVEYWQQVDLYVGGAAHAVMHLLYARFWHKVLYDVGLVPTPEPFKTLFNQGLITGHAYKDDTGRLVPSDQVEHRGKKWFSTVTGEEVERFVAKMSKSLKNVVNPDDVIEKYGTDTLRLYEMFMGPLDAEKPWSNEGITGSYKFINRLWNLFIDDLDKLKPQFAIRKNNPLSEKELIIERGLNRCLVRIDESFKNYNFNIAVAAGMEFINIAYEHSESMNRSQAERFILMLSPLIPHITEELWQQLGHAESLAYQKWPKVIPEYLEEATFELVIQHNGKMRKKVTVDKSLSDEEIKQLACTQLIIDFNSPNIVKMIYVPNRLVNIVVKQ
ncbi:MAG: leucine--tRNA ligase [Gammaproteobacteria bacterium]